MYLLCLFSFATAFYQTKTKYFHSESNLSTLFFDDHERISILSKSNTYFFISSPTPKYISYSIIKNQSFDRNKITQKKGKIHNENEFIFVNNTSYMQAYFNLNKKIMRKYQKFIHTKKTSSISFLSFESNDICKNGVEFIQSEKEYQHKKGKEKCFYLILHNKKVAVLYTENGIFSSSSSLETSLVHNEISINKTARKNKGRNHLKLLSSQDSSNIKDSRSLLESANNNNYICKYRKKYLPAKRSIFSNINSSIMLLIVVFISIFLISLCAGKQSVEATDPNDNNQTTPINNLPPNNYYYNNNQLNNSYNVPPPVSTPSFQYNQINPNHPSSTISPIQQMAQLYPANATNQANPPNTMNMNIYPSNNNGGMSCAYHNNVQPNGILPPANPPYNDTSSAYPGVVQYSGALPMPSGAQSSINMMNQVINYY